MSVEIINYTKLINEKIYTENINPIVLAKYIGKNYCSFNENELKMLEIYWEPAFNKNWLYAHDDMVENIFGHKNGKDMMYNFSNKLKKEFDENIDFQVVSSNHEIVQFYCSLSDTTNKSRGGHNKNHYIITGETFKQILMGSNLEKGKQMKKYYIKVENLARMTINAISKCCKYLSDKQLQEKEKLLLESKEAYEKQQKELEEAKQKNLNLRTIIKNTQMHDFDGYLYFVTNFLFFLLFFLIAQFFLLILLFYLFL